MSAVGSPWAIRFEGLTTEENEVVQQLADPFGADCLHRRDAISLFGEISRLRKENAALRAKLNMENSLPTSAHTVQPFPEERLIVDEFGTRTAENTRIRNVCWSLGVKTLGELCLYSREELLYRRNFGRRCLDRTEEVLASRGLSLRKP